MRGRPKIPPTQESAYIFTRQGLAEVLGVSQQRVSWLVNMGMPQEPNGRFDIRACVQHLLAQAKVKAKSSSSKMREQLVQAQRDRIRLEIAKLRSELIPSVLVEQTLSAVAALVSTQLDGLGARLAGELADIDSPQIIQQRLFEEGRAIRTMLAARIAAYAEELSSTEVPEEQPEETTDDDDL